MNESFGVSWFSIFAQLLNLVLVVFVFIVLPIMVWKKLIKWNEKRNEQLESIREGIHEIKEILRNEKRKSD